MSGYVDLPGEQRVYVEVHGSGGEPVFLLHGGFQGADSWAAQIKALEDGYHVFVPERRGHGRSPDVPGPYTIPVMAEETAAVIQTLAQGPAHLVGWSDGAYVAAWLTLHRPELVRSAVWIGQPLAEEGRTSGERSLVDDPHLASYFRDDYIRTSPDGPEHYEVVFRKVLSLWQNPVEMSFEEFASITAPVLVLQGDDDGVRIDWNRRVAATIPRGQFAVVPGTGHGAPLQRAAVVNQMILDFLADPEPERFLGLGALKDT
ncbi:alpha/beta hydrolase [Actinoplanes sp. NPDC051633]|uniref:alpha/beta fold hydrolase n=1 Tax=Actinoplanes sp. NPDC051633 TaxID=3155670 RepID=UPI00341B9E70